MKRRQFIRQVTKAGAMGAAALSPLVSVAQDAKSIPADAIPEHKFLTKPYLQYPAADGMSVMWITNTPCYSWVEYGEGKALNSKTHAVSEGLVQAYNRINSIRLYNLKPGTSYSYRVASKEMAPAKPWETKYGNTLYSDIYTFITPPAKPESLSMLIFNDIHDRPESIPHLLQYKGPEPVDFAFFNGDVFNQQVDEQQIIDHMLEPCTSCFASTVPFMLVRGNHETRGKYARELHSYFTNYSPHFYYTFTWGPAYVVVLDTGEDKVDDHEEYAGLSSFDDYRREQARWVEKEMQTKAFRDAKFRIVLMHIPHFYSNGWHGPSHCQELFAPLFNKYKVDISLSGHTHKFGVFDPVPGQHNYPIIIGGGPKDGNRTLIKLKADHQNLTVSMLKDDGTEVGKYALKSRK